MAKVKSNAQLYITPTDYTATPQTLASVSAAAPAVATAVAALPANLVAGGFAYFDGTGAADLDGTTWRVANPQTVAKTFELQDSDRTGEAVDTGRGTYTPYDTATDLVHACMVNITVTGVAPDSIAMDDMCTNTTVYGDPKPPTMTFTGFVDKDSPGFAALMQASLESPKQTHFIVIDYGTDVGYIAGNCQIGEITITAATAAGLQFSGTGVFTEIPTYSWALAPVPA
jgi:hypothetical protein